MLKDKLILVVDDTPELLEMVRSILARAGYTNILTASCAKEIPTLLGSRIPDLFLLDVLLPDMDGFAILQEIRSCSNIPVLLISALGEDDDRLTALELGADAYLVKPFIPRELVLRVNNLLKRAYPSEVSFLQLDGAQVNMESAEVVKGDQILHLTAKELMILQRLARSEGHIVTVGALCECLCGGQWHGYESTLMTHIRHLRQKIEANPSKPVSLLTIRGLGYMLVTPSGAKAKV